MKDFGTKASHETVKLGSDESFFNATQRVEGINMPEQIYNYEPAAALDSAEAIEVFMADAFETGNSGYIAEALGVVARAKGMSQIANET